MEEERDIEKIRHLWESETDEYLIQAATIDILEYPPDVQRIIREEARRRGLPTEQKKAPDRQLPQTEAEIREQKRALIKAQIQRVIGIAGSLLFVAFVVIVDVVNPIPLGKAAVIRQFQGISALLLAMFCFALITKRPKFAVRICRTCEMMVIASFCYLVVVAMMEYRQETLKEVGLSLIISYTALCIVWCIVFFVLEVGLKGLRSLQKNN